MSIKEKIIHYWKSFIIVIVLISSILAFQLFHTNDKEQMSKIIVVKITGDVNQEGEYSVNDSMSIAEIINKYCLGVKQVANPIVNISASNPSIKQFKKVNINTATLEQLQEIPNVGKIKAQNILDYRNLHGKFTKIEDLANVKGIGESTVEKLRPYIEV